MNNYFSTSTRVPGRTARSWFNPVVAVMAAGILWLGATYAMEGKITVGTILVFLAYLGALYEPINSIVYTTATLQTLSANAARAISRGIAASTSDHQVER